MSRNAGTLAPEARGSPGRLGGFLRTGIYCTAIAALLAFLDVSPFGTALVVSLSIGLAITGAFALLQAPLEPRLGPWLSPALLVALGIIAGLLVAGALLFGRPLHYLVGSPGTLVLGLAFGVVGYLVFGTRARLLRSRLQIAELERSRAEQDRQLADTRLRLLQAQIEPHFLFNTLGTVQSLMRSDPATAEHVLAQLTALLRQSLARTREGRTTLGEEIELVRAYLEIQAVRMGGRLGYTIDLPTRAAGLALPPLLLQPLVENAITHGIEPRPGPGRVAVRVSREADFVTIRVEDDGTGPAGPEDANPASSGTGTALANIRARLAEHYGPAATLRLLEAPGSGVVAELRLPVAPGEVRARRR